MSTNLMKSTAGVLVVTIRRIVSAAIMALAMVGLVLTPSANAADQVAVNDRVKDSVVLINIEYEGRVLVPGEYRWDIRAEDADYAPPKWMPFVAEFGCTGFVVDTTGLIATAGHCVDNIHERGKQGLREQFLEAQVDQGNLTRDEGEQKLA